MSGGGWTYKANGVKFRLDYTGYPQSVTAPIVGAEYDFSIAGAASGLKLTGNETPIAYDGLAQGGRAQGRKVMEPSQTFWIHVGGQGTSAGPMDSGACRSQWGGWNGGGRGSRGGAGGGGATDVRLRDGDLSARILVAGGGGGCGYGGSACDDVGGAGGGLTGSDGTNRGGYGGGKGGSQTAGGLSGMNNTIGAGGFGFGGDAVQCNDEGGGGGGWYGGGAGGEDNRPGGGGSSYIAGVSNGATQTGGNNSHGWAEYIFR
jgi:hypothetical protein